MPPNTTLAPECEQRGHDAIEILAGARDGQSAQAIVPAKSHDHQHWLQTQCVLQPVDSVFGGVSTDPLIDHLVAIALRVQILLQVIGIAVARVGAEAGGEAVAESDDHRPPVGRRCWFAGRRLRSRRFRSIGAATGKKRRR